MIPLAYKHAHLAHVVCINSPDRIRCNAAGQPAFIKVYMAHILGNFGFIAVIGIFKAAARYIFRLLIAVYVVSARAALGLGSFAAGIRLYGRPALRHARAEEEKRTFDFVVSRAVMPLADLIKIIKKNISSKQQNALPNGLICLKGGELEHETMPFKHKTVIHSLSDNFEEEFFKTKKVVYVPI